MQPALTRESFYGFFAARSSSKSLTSASSSKKDPAGYFKINAYFKCKKESLKMVCVVQTFPDSLEGNIFRTSSFEHNGTQCI